MRRREFITLLGSTTVAWPLAARAQQSAKLPTIGFLSPASPASWTSWTNAFVKRLRELGWIEGHTVAIEYHWAEGRSERFAEFAAEFVGLKVDVIVTAGSAVAAAKRATSTIPDRLRGRRGPSWRRLRHELGTTGRQHHRIVAPAERCGR